MKIQKLIEDHEKQLQFLYPYAHESIEIGENITDHTSKRADDLIKLLCFYARQTETIRRLIEYQTDKINLQNLLQIVALDSGYSIQWNDKIVQIIMPPLLPKTGSRYYQQRVNLISCLNRLLDFYSTNIPCEYLHRTSCVVVLEHERVNKFQRFDYDNLEFKNTLDILADYFLAGDEAKNIALFQDYKEGLENKTNVYIMPKSKFSAWYEAR